MYMYYLMIYLLTTLTIQHFLRTYNLLSRETKISTYISRLSREQGQRGCLNRIKLPKAQGKKSKGKQVLRTCCGPKGNNILQNHMFKALHTQDAKHLNCSPFTMFTLFYFFLHHVPLSTPCSLFLCQRAETAIHVATLFQPLTTQ